MNEIGTQTDITYRKTLWSAVTILIGSGPEENSEKTGTSWSNEREMCHSERMKLVLLHKKGNLYKYGIDVFFTWSNRAYVRIIIKVSGAICLFSFFYRSTLFYWILVQKLADIPSSKIGFLSTFHIVWVHYHNVLEVVYRWYWFNVYTYRIDHHFI